MHGTANKEPVILNELLQSSFDFGNLHHPVSQEPPIEETIEGVLRMRLILQVQENLQSRRRTRDLMLGYNSRFRSRRHAYRLNRRCPCVEWFLASASPLGPIMQV